VVLDDEHGVADRQRRVSVRRRRPAASEDRFKRRPAGTALTSREPAALRVDFASARLVISATPCHHRAPPRRHKQADGIIDLGPKAAKAVGGIVAQARPNSSPAQKNPTPARSLPVYSLSKPQGQMATGKKK